MIILLIYWAVSFDCNHMILHLVDSQHVLVYQVNFSELLIMSILHTIPNFPKCTNIGAVFWPTVYTHISRVHNLETYSGLYRQREHLWTLIDPNLYMCWMDLFPYYSLCFSSHIFSQKDFIIPYIIANRITDFPHHIASCMTSPPYILLFSQHSPVICKDFFPFVYMYKSSRYYAVFHIDLGPMFPRSTSL